MGCNRFSNVSQITDKTFNKFNPSKNTIIEKIELIIYYFNKLIEFFGSSKSEKKIKKKQKGVL